MHPELREALAGLLKVSKRRGPIVQSARGAHLRANSVVNWFIALFREIGAEGCSSHSGRRTFITQAARSAHSAGASLRDVQLLAGHQSIETTQRYIDGDTDAQRRLVKNLARKGKRYAN
jgi:integrase/recombinase XerD